MRNTKTTKLLTTPLIIFSLFFVVVPLIYVFIFSFLKRDEVWGVTTQFTLGNYEKLIDPVYINTFVISLQLAVATTILTMLIGYPFGYFMAKLAPAKRKIVMLLVIIPFWTNALVRIYGWMVLLRTNGTINTMLLTTGIIEEPLKMLYTYGSVLVGMVYSLLPFMILPVYSSVEKMDWTLVEAARDLGASKFRAFWSVTFKLTLPGLLSGFVLVFVPSMSLFFIADLLGGGKIMLVGNLIQNQFLQARDWPFGATLSVAMMILTLSFIVLYRKVTKSDLEGIV